MWNERGENSKLIKSVKLCTDFSVKFELYIRNKIINLKKF